MGSFLDREDFCDVPAVETPVRERLTVLELLLFFEMKANFDLLLLLISSLLLLDLFKIPALELIEVDVICAFTRCVFE